MLFWASMDHFIVFWAPLAHFILLGHPRAASFPWASPAHSNPPFPWVFAKSFGLLRPKLPYPLLSGFIGFSTNPYLLNSFLGLLRPILACFPFLIMPIGLLLLSLDSFRPVCFPWDPFAILQAYGPLFRSFGLNCFLLNLLILLLYPSHIVGFLPIIGPLCQSGHQQYVSSCPWYAFQLNHHKIG